MQEGEGLLFVPTRKLELNNNFLQSFFSERVGTTQDLLRHSNGNNDAEERALLTQFQNLRISKDGMNVSEDEYNNFIKPSEEKKNSAFRLRNRNALAAPKTKSTKEKKKKETKTKKTKIKKSSEISTFDNEDDEEAFNEVSSPFVIEGARDFSYKPSLSHSMSNASVSMSASKAAPPPSPQPNAFNSLSCSAPNFRAPSPQVVQMRVVELDWTQRFQESLSNIYSVSRKNKVEMKRRCEQLANLAKQFVSTATQSAKVIIDEYSLPDINKTIKPLHQIGGQAGGTKYIDQKILFKLAVDTGKGIKDEEAMKIAGHELKSLDNLLSCKIAELYFPLLCVIEYSGFRLVAISVLPINPSTIQYGSADSGYTIYNSNPHLAEKIKSACKYLNLSSRLASSLNPPTPTIDQYTQSLPSPSVPGYPPAITFAPSNAPAYTNMYSPPYQETYNSPYSPPSFISPPTSPNYHPSFTNCTTSHTRGNIYSSLVSPSSPVHSPPSPTHTVNNGHIYNPLPPPPHHSYPVISTPTEIYGPVDLEGHVGTDGKFYLIDFSRLFPSDYYQYFNTESCFYLYHLLRPEIVKSNSFPLCSDSISNFITNPEEKKRYFLEIQQVNKEIIYRIIPHFSASLSLKNPSLLKPLHFIQSLHRCGINVRYLGIVRSYLLSNPSNSPYAKEWTDLILVEMIARTLRWKLRADLRQFKSSSPSSSSPSPNFLIQFFRYFFLHHESSAIVWADIEEKIGKKFYVPPPLLPGTTLASYLFSQPRFRSILLDRFCDMNSIDFNILNYINIGNPQIVDYSLLSDLIPQVKQLHIINYCEAIAIYLQVNEVLEYAKKSGLPENDAGTNNKVIVLYKQSLHYFEKALECNPSEVSTLLFCAKLNGKLFNLERAKLYFEIAMNVNQKDPFPVFKYARFCEKSNQPFDYTEKFYLLSLQIDSSFVPALLHYANYLSSHRADEEGRNRAMSCFLRAKSILDPHLATNSTNEELRIMQSKFLSFTSSFVTRHSIK